MAAALSSAWRPRTRAAPLTSPSPTTRCTGACYRRTRTASPFRLIIFGSRLVCRHQSTGFLDLFRLFWVWWNWIIPDLINSSSDSCMYFENSKQLLSAEHSCAAPYVESVFLPPSDGPLRGPSWSLLIRLRVACQLGTQDWQGCCCFQYSSFLEACCKSTGRLLSRNYTVAVKGLIRIGRLGYGQGGGQLHLSAILDYPSMHNNSLAAQFKTKTPSCHQQLRLPFPCHARQWWVGG